IITAAIGGLLLALGLYLLTNTIVTPGLAGLGVFLLGALVQTATIKRKQRARTRAAATPPPPPPPPIEQATMDPMRGIPHPSCIAGIWSWLAGIRSWPT